MVPLPPSWPRLEGLTSHDRPRQGRAPTIKAKAVTKHKSEPVVVIPAGAEHETWFREDTEVIDFFAPPRDDFLVGGRPTYMSETEKWRKVVNSQGPRRIDARVAIRSRSSRSQSMCEEPLSYQSSATDTA